MNSPLDYLVAAITFRFAYEGNKFSLPGTIEALCKNVNEYYNVAIDSPTMRHAVQTMNRLNIISFTEDMYAGISLTASQDNVDNIYTQFSQSNPALYPKNLGAAPIFFRKVLKNPKFWTDLDAQLSEQSLEDGIPESLHEVPASDRVVTILHNSDEGKMISESLDKVISDLNHNNEVANEAGHDRPRFIAEARAAQELVKGETVRKNALVEVLWRFFRELLTKFKDRATDWGIDKVLALLDQMLDLIK